MLFTCLAYLAFGLMYAYEEVMRETRNIMFKDKINLPEPAEML